MKFYVQFMIKRNTSFTHSVIALYVSSFKTKTKKSVFILHEKVLIKIIHIKICMHQFLKISSATLLTLLE